MKTCNTCKSAKPKSEYYRQPSAKEGLMAKCKECAKAAARENRRAKADYYREYDKWRYQNDPKVKDRHQRYAKTERGKLSHRRAHERWKYKNTAKRAVHVMTGNAIRDGVLRKQSCEICGAEKVHAHHDDYAKPLDVRWLCPLHHKEWHEQNGEGANAR